MNSSQESGPHVEVYGSDTTLRWSCRRGEFLLWVGMKSIFGADRASSWDIRDFWQFQDGDHVLITNRWPDVPGWFELHPLEVAGSAVPQMMRRLKEGYEPSEVFAAMNIWRAPAGDRLIWVTVDNAANPVKALLDLKACALVIGENVSLEVDSFSDFGLSEDDLLPAASAAALRSGFDAAVALGVPRVYAPEWRFGA